jgi:cell division protein ZapA
MKPVRESIKVQVMGKEFAVACDVEEKSTLLAATRFLDEQIENIQSQGKIVGNDRIAIMVAINLASELLELREQQANTTNLQNDLNTLSEKIDRAMVDS